MQLVPILALLTAVAVLAGCAGAGVPANEPGQPSPSAHVAPSTTDATVGARTAQPAALAKPTPTTKPAPVPVSGVDGSFTLVLPPAWTRLATLRLTPITDEVNALVVRSGLAAAAVKAAIANAYAGMEEGAYMFAMRSASMNEPNDRLPVLSVMHWRSNGETLAVYEKRIARTLNAIPTTTTDVSHKRVTYPSGTALWLSYGVEKPNRNGQVERYHATVVVFHDKRHEWALMLSTPAKPDKATLSEFIAMAKSFRKLAP